MFTSSTWIKDIPKLIKKTYMKMCVYTLHCKKRFSFFSSPAGMSLTQLSQEGNSLIIPGQGDFG